MNRPVSASLCVVLGLLAAAPGRAQTRFPFDREMLLDVAPMRGSKRVPVLEIAADGQAQIDLWCKRGQGRAEIAGDAITLVIGAMRDEPCTPERARGDEDMLAALAQVKGWQRKGDVVVLEGATTLRFRLATN